MKFTLMFKRKTKLPQAFKRKCQKKPDLQQKSYEFHHESDFKLDTKEI